MKWTIAYVPKPARNPEPNTTISSFDIATMPPGELDHECGQPEAGH